MRREIKKKTARVSSAIPRQSVPIRNAIMQVISIYVRTCAVLGEYKLCICAAWFQNCQIWQMSLIVFLRIDTGRFDWWRRQISVWL